MRLSKAVFLQGAFIVALSTASGLAFNFFYSGSIPLIHRPLKVESGKHVTLAEAHRIFLEGKALFIDSRSPAEFTSGHIKGAKNIPAGLEVDEILERLEDVSRRRLLVAYCGGST